jgi:hypothetical protein
MILYVIAAVTIQIKGYWEGWGMEGKGRGKGRGRGRGKGLGTVAYLGGHCAMAPLWLMGKFFEGLEDRWKGGW